MFNNERIIKARETQLKSKWISKLPQINFEEQDYIDFIDWQSTSVTEPPLTNNLSK